MENRQQQILSEIKSMMASVRSQLELLDAKMAEFQQIIDSEYSTGEPIEIELDIDDVPEIIPLDDVPDEPEAPAVEPAEQASIQEDLPEDIFACQETVTVAEKAEEEAKPIINDVLVAECAWRRDMPGAQVRDIRSAISLNDRVIFINLLFDEDAQSFVNALAKINAMETLDEAVEFVTSEFPSWDMNSELVYRFMMDVRRKLQ